MNLIQELAVFSRSSAHLSRAGTAKCLARDFLTGWRLPGQFFSAENYVNGNSKNQRCRRESRRKELPIRKTGICWIWLGAVGIVLSGASIAFTQETSPMPEATAEVERIIVTGSYIPSAAEVGPNPVQTIGRDLINNRASAQRKS